MLFMAGGGKVTRVHGPFLNDMEVENVTSFLIKQSVPDYDETIIEEQNINENDNENLLFSNNSKDELYDEAVKLVVREQKASTSFIQRHLELGITELQQLLKKWKRII